MLATGHRPIQRESSDAVTRNVSPKKTRTAIVENDRSDAHARPLPARPEQRGFACDIPAAWQEVVALELLRLGRVIVAQIGLRHRGCRPPRSRRRRLGHMRCSGARRAHGLLPAWHHLKRPHENDCNVTTDRGHCPVSRRRPRGVGASLATVLLTNALSICLGDTSGEAASLIALGARNCSLLTCCNSDRAASSPPPVCHRGRNPVRGTASWLYRRRCLGICSAKPVGACHRTGCHCGNHARSGPPRRRDVKLVWRSGESRHGVCCRSLVKSRVETLAHYAFYTLPGLVIARVAGIGSLGLLFSRESPVCR